MSYFEGKAWHIYRYKYKYIKSQTWATTSLSEKENTGPSPLSPPFITHNPNCKSSFLISQTLLLPLLLLSSLSSSFFNSINTSSLLPPLNFSFFFIPCMWKSCRKAKWYVLKKKMLDPVRFEGNRRFSGLSIKPDESAESTAYPIQLMARTVYTTGSRFDRLVRSGFQNYAWNQTKPTMLLFNITYLHVTCLVEEFNYLTKFTSTTMPLALYVVIITPIIINTL